MNITMGGCSQCNNNNNNNPLEKPHLISQPHLNTYTKVSNLEVINHSYDHNINDLKPKSLLMKMVWEFGFGCFVGEREKNIMISSKNGSKNISNNNSKNVLEHNNAWLLAESGGDLANAEPYSVHSSFRFNICSQLELESVSTTGFSTSSTVLMVNLDDNVSHSDSYSKDFKWRRVESLEKCISPVSSSLIRFSFDEILSATRNFSQGRVLGRGALSCVFRGRVGLLRTAVAIKRLDKEDKETPKAFCRELMIASSLQHPNIVPLLGFCIDPDEGLFLVYKYVSSGSLEHHLHGRKKGVKGFASLSWKARYKVAVGIAEAIAYLHNGTEKCIVHRDIKPSNILLSSKKRPKLCDFGLATWTTAPSVPFLCKTVKGTFGYLAPEYFQHGKVSDKTDVYAFGVVLLELITGRKPIETTRPPGEENLVQWAKPLLNQGEATLDTLLDPRAKLTPKSSKLITQMVQATSACLANEECNRPGINEAITLLRGENCSSKSKAGLGRYGSVSQRFQRSKSELRNHLTLAMLGVCELDSDDYFYSR